MTVSRPLARLTRIAVLVAIGDYVTKHLALLFISGHEAPLGSLVRLAVVHNDKAAFGWSAGAYTFELNLALTLATIALIIPVNRDLARFDASAPTALGLIVGGALGNLISLILSPLGVIDFIAIHRGGGREFVLNVADVAAYIGLAMIVRTGVVLVRTIHRRREADAADIADSFMIARSARADAEVPRLVANEAGQADDRQGGSLGDPDLALPRPNQRARRHLRLVNQLRARREEADGVPRADETPQRPLHLIVPDEDASTRRASGPSHVRPMSHRKEQ